MDDEYNDPQAYDMDEEPEVEPDEELTPENANALMLEYFTVEPMITWDAKGKVVKVPCDVPTVAGFASRYNMAPSRFKGWIEPETLELCQAKFEHVMVTNGLGRGYDAGFASLTMKNLAGWRDKTESVVMERRELAPEDRILLESMGLRIAGTAGRTPLIDNLPSGGLGSGVIVTADNKLITQPGERV